MKKIDLHVHTNKSDGTFSPEQAVDYARAKGLAAIAITDHDTVSGVNPAMMQAQKFANDLEVISGIEISAEWTEGGEELEIHMLGYFIDWESEVLQKNFDNLSEARIIRAERIIEKLRQHNILIDMDDVLAFAPSTESIGRLHIAQAIQKEGYVQSTNKAFDMFLGNNKCCYVPKHQLDPEGALKLIRDLKGLSVIAHPGFLKKDFALSLIQRMVKSGLDGIEVYYPEHREETKKYFEEIAKTYGLLMTGGTDCHGTVKEHIMMGTLDIPYELLEKMKQRRDEKISSLQRNEPAV